MIPSAFIQMDNLPLTLNGKIDHQSLPAPDSPDSRAEFEQPQTRGERALAGIWERVLGVQQVGLHDNFFELGGDSILSIQVIARANQAGYRLTPKHLFRHQTIFELAMVAESLPTVGAEQDTVTGLVHLTPIQRAYFGRNPDDPNHFNHAVLLEAREPLDPDRLTETVKLLMETLTTLCHSPVLIFPDCPRWSKSRP
jgi:hypothetical protein